VIRLLTVRLNRDEDVVAARRRARQVAEALGFDSLAQTRFATAVSEIARNASRYATGGRVEFSLDNDSTELVVTVADRGPGIPHLASVLDGTYRSSTGLGLGIVGTQRLVDAFSIEAAPGQGTVVEMRKQIPARPGARARIDVGTLADRLAREEPVTPADEVAQQNRELLNALEELGRRQDDLTRLNAELQDTNRGVLALYAELDEKAEHLRRADEMKSKFLSNMTHEFQTPLNSILALTRLLLDRTDGDLTDEQQTQVQYIREATQNLSELVHDLLDLAKVEAGKVAVRPATFNVDELFGVMRGLMRPLQVNDAVALIFETAETLPSLYTDEGKVSQILRNYVSNALKFTERGEVRVRARHDDDGRIRFEVSDTGIGIAAQDQGRLFHEFGQVPNRLQAHVRGTGLGLSLSKRLAELLGGTVGLSSVPGEGSTFWLSIPPSLPGAELPQAAAAGGAAAAETVRPPLVLIADDEMTARYVMRRFVIAAGCRVLEASGGQEALRLAAAEHPDAILLDVRMPDMLGTEVLARLKRNPATANIPVIVATSQIMSDAERRRLSAHAVAVLGKGRMGEADGDRELRDALRAANIAI
jgi:signal transduction histidine kinase